ncbi:MAG TPA: glycerol-3-phosphate dehydrogenase/oxidase [Myxococcota bacterium]|nr:glycerol-3-phosphate dehydrogenase/oxidase [Myxococcota bacterium]HOH76734.1 glycerol-3-phosphate dehydrogenase/oxidase [Myxococcota bacterium]
MTMFNINARDDMLAHLSGKVWDVLVIGGGITGAGIARDSAMRGLDTALVERDDFSIGTSSRSSKLVHGGLRYLKNREFGLVHESTTERNLLTKKIAPNLVRPLPFLVPIWQTSKPGYGAMRAAMVMYDVLAELNNFRAHRALTVSELLKRAPALRRDGLRGGFVYYDSISDDTRLTLELVIDAHRHGAVPVSRVEALETEFENGRVRGVTVRDTINDRRMFVHARSVIVATGIWSSETAAALGIAPAARLDIRPTRGSHIVLPYDKFPIDSAVTMLAPRDKRAMFVIPWNGMTVLGTTDTDYQGDLCNVFCSRDDALYLLEAAHHNFPGITAGLDDIVGTWSGLRPLIASEGSESAVSREHSIVVDDRGVVTIAGGKLTTYRIMADQALKAAAPFFNKPLRRSTAGRVPLPCSAGLADAAARRRLSDEIVTTTGVSAAIADNLVVNHGVRARDVAALVVKNPGLAAPILAGHPFILAEVVQAIRCEMAVTLADVLLRRTPVFFLGRDDDESATRAAANVMAAELGWDQARVDSEIAQVAEIRRRHQECL